MKLIYKILIVLAAPIIIGSSLNVFTWTKELLKVFWTGVVMGALMYFLVSWLVKGDGK